MKQATRAFTLIELLVVIAIIAILAAILFPVFTQAKAAANRTAELSNVKNLALGQTLYMTDNDDRLVLLYQANWSRPRYEIVLWKDSIYPYIKNGGLQILPPGQYYTREQQTNGGIFGAPTFSGIWQRFQDSGATYYGDTSSRFPRAWALNADAGKNENLGDTSSIESEDATVWGRAYTWNGDPNIYVRGGGGAYQALENIAGTAMIAGTRTPFPAMNSRYFAYRCDDYWCGAANSQTSYGRGSGNRLVTMAFFDGHAKTVNGFKSFADDNWGMYRVRCTTNDWPCAPAVTYWMSQIGEWR